VERATTRSGVPQDLGFDGSPTHDDEAESQDCNPTAVRSSLDVFEVDPVAAELRGLN